MYFLHQFQWKNIANMHVSESERYLVFIFWSENRKVYVKIQYRKSSINTIFLLSKIHIGWIVKIEKSGWKCNFLQKISMRKIHSTWIFKNTKIAFISEDMLYVYILDICARNHYARQTYDMSKYACTCEKSIVVDCEMMMRVWRTICRYS